MVISLPDVDWIWPITVRYFTRNKFEITLRKPKLKLHVHQFDGQHYWEVNKFGYELSKVTKDFCLQGFSLTKTYRVKENPFHRFFVFAKN